MGVGYEALLELYPGALVRAGQVYPVVVDPVGVSTADLAIEVERASDPALRAAGAAHLEARRTADPTLTNGPTACWHANEADAVLVGPGRYFDMIATCDILKAEFEDVEPTTGWPVRALVHELAGDPLRSGAGRAAAIGVSVILTLPDADSRTGTGTGTGTGSSADGERAFVIGRRGSVSSDRGRWHVAPSGMLELNGDRDPVAATVATELLEELGIAVDVEAVAGRMVVLGMIHDLLRLRPDLVVRLDLVPAEVPAELMAASEFSELSLIPSTPAGLAEFWTAHPPGRLTPAAAGAVALFEASLSTTPASN